MNHVHNIPASSGPVAALHRLPVLLGLDLDNGSEFINHHLHASCERRGITFTRFRYYLKRGGPPG